MFGFQNPNIPASDSKMSITMILLLQNDPTFPNLKPNFPYQVTTQSVSYTHLTLPTMAVV